RVAAGGQQGTRSAAQVEQPNPRPRRAGRRLRRELPISDPGAEAAVPLMAHPLRFGLKASGQAISIEDLRAVWRLADESGFDHVWDFDHLASIGPGGPDRPIYEGWALQAAMAEATK